MVSREHFCAYLRENWPRIIDTAKLNASAVFDELKAMGPDETINRFLAKGVSFGDFKPNDIDWQKELIEELHDAVSYTAIGEFSQD